VFLNYLPNARCACYGSEPLDTQSALGQPARLEERAGDYAAHFNPQQSLSASAPTVSSDTMHLSHLIGCQVIHLTPVERVGDAYVVELLPHPLIERLRSIGERPG
jgi:hypothetical protein